ncbi:putative gamma-tubulin complex component 5 [Podospora fimiseda]|uniref:Spindle pole body component n=1 Tax=Podospora fimiseda TaxID=252190 RepID=A0AAN7BSM8_9PEZI|nr:putative gamma-tubulin complex component 5 [Podospora fimiseda]
MAYQAELAAQCDELVTAVTNIPENHKHRNIYREFVLRSLREHSFLRTNQFEVADRLKGLEERFRVVGRDALADAFRQRLDALEPHWNHTSPDVLHFILELADQPAQKSKLTDLDLLKEPEEEPQPTLTWREIAREDGWKHERDIWRINDWAPDSSDEEEIDVRSVASAESVTSASSVDERIQRTALDLAFKPQGEKELQQLADSLAWRYEHRAEGENGSLEKTTISTLLLVREVLFMLGGLETTMFDAKCNPSMGYQLAGVSSEAYQALVTSFAECGRKLTPLRVFAKGREQSPLLQVFQDSVQKALRTFDMDLATIQGRFVAIKEDVVVSPVGILTELRPKLKPLYALADIVRQLQEERNPHAFRYLELLYDAVGMAQLQGHNATYELLGSIFLDCFQVYLKPIRMWMEEGRLLPGDRTFFVSESPTKLPLPQIWQSQFNLLRTPEGNLHAPRFLKPAISRIFNAGKSIVVLKHMKQDAATSKYRATVEPKMDFEAVCSGDVEFAPFSELFGAAFQAWIQSKHHTAAATLRELLYSSYGLSRGLDTLEKVYLMSDGASSTAFTSAIFRHLDNLSSSWKDRFTLTEIAQEAFSSSVDGYRIFAQVDPRALTHSAIASRSSVRLSLPLIRVGCRLNWPVQIVVPEEGIRAYQTIFTFLLQIRRAVYLLQHAVRDFHPTSLDARGQMATYYLLRTKLLWFCNVILTYLTTLVLAPQTARLRSDLRDAADVDDMITAHSEFTRRIINESCLGVKLQPIRECILDILDLAIKVQDVQRVEMVRLTEEEQEVQRLSVMSSPYKSPSKKKRGILGLRSPRGKKADEEDEDGDGDIGGDSVRGRNSSSSAKPHHVLLKEMLGDFERYLRFVAGGLRGVARASKDEAATRWDLLAEMLETGIKE